MPQIAKPHTVISLKLAQPLADWMAEQPTNRTALIEAAIELLMKESDIDRLSGVGLATTPEGLKKIKTQERA